MRYDSYKLYKARKIKGWNLTQTALVARVAISTVHRAERGKFNNPYVLKKIVDALGLNMEEVLIDEPPQEDRCASA